MIVLYFGILILFIPCLYLFLDVVFNFLILIVITIIIDETHIGKGRVHLGPLVNGPLLRVTPSTLTQVRHSTTY